MQFTIGHSRAYKDQAHYKTLLQPPHLTPIICIHEDLGNLFNPGKEAPGLSDRGFINLSTYLGKSSGGLPLLSYLPVDSSTIR